MAINILSLFTGTTSNPSADTNIGFPPPNVIQNCVDAPPSIIRKRTFSPALNSGYSIVSFPLIRNAG